MPECPWSALSVSKHQESMKFLNKMHVHIPSKEKLFVAENIVQVLKLQGQGLWF